MQGRGRRVAITGFGVVAPCGIGKDAFWAGLNGPGLSSGRSVEISDWDPSPYYANEKESRRADRVEQFAVAVNRSEFGSAAGFANAFPKVCPGTQTGWHKCLKSD